MMSPNEIKLPFSGLFKRCLKIPALQSGEAVKYADKLMKDLDREKSIDIDTAPEKRDPAFSTDYLFSNAGGQMFGILVCRNLKGETAVLKAFSGQYNSRWTAPGWIPPVIDPEDFDSVVSEKDKEIKNLDREIADSADIGNTADRIKKLKEKRKNISQDLMREIHSLYYLHNFNGEKELMSKVFRRKGDDAEQTEETAAMPSGTGDCCAPKLLNFAAKEGLIPLSIIEFYYGMENKSGTKKHKHFYPPCAEKCEPIMEFMISGIKEKESNEKKQPS